MMLSIVEIECSVASNASDLQVPIVDNVDKESGVALNSQIW